MFVSTVEGLASVRGDHAPAHELQQAENGLVAGFGAGRPGVSRHTTTAVRGKWLSPQFFR